MAVRRGRGGLWFRRRLGRVGQALAGVALLLSLPTRNGAAQELPAVRGVVPEPLRMQVSSARTHRGEVLVPGPFVAQVGVLRDALVRLGAAGVRVVPEVPADVEAAVRFVVRSGLGDEEYRIGDRDGPLVVEAATPRGAARAAATLAQLARIEDDAVVWPGLAVEDRPDKAFRCFMVDLGRNPHPPELLRQVCDAAWFYKLNFLHLHLTDDQIVSWPSRAFPDIYTERSGWSWDDYVGLEAYASARGLAIIPEIDVPGHSTILRRAYPEVFGEDPTALATSAAAQEGMETLIDELLSVFASTPYVHLGGDEAYGVPAAAQRDFINRLDRFVRARGRRSIVWEGPGPGEGEGAVHRDVVHVNWQTTAFPAQKMLDAGYTVVNAAWDPYYIVDHYPRTMFTAVSLERLYGSDLGRFGHVEPGMPTFARPHVVDRDRIAGFLMPWWEGRPENLLGLCVPRMAAASCGAWNRAGEREFGRFMQRQVHAAARFERIADAELPRLPLTADPAAAREDGNLAFGCPVTVHRGATQPVFGPVRLTNGITDRFDHFLGYPTQPEPLDITVDLGGEHEVGRVVVHETAVGSSHEVYELQVASAGGAFETVGRAGQGTRGDASFVEHRFGPRPVRYVRIRTRGCHGLTFPSFSRLCEVEVFATGGR